jgi:hypothetical protein
MASVFRILAVPVFVLALGACGGGGSDGAETPANGASFLAHPAVGKCADPTPIYPLEKAFQRQGIPGVPASPTRSSRRPI